MIETMHSSWDNTIKFPTVNKTISLEDAEKMFLTKYEPKLLYLNWSQEYIDNENIEAKLAYSLSPKSYGYIPAYIDAESGKFLDFNGQELLEKDSSDSFSDMIKSHWAEKELGILAYHGIIDSSTFQLDKEITFKELITMLVKAKGIEYYRDQSFEELKFTNVDKDSELYIILQTAVHYGLIENTEGEFDGDRNITREDFSVYIVKLLGYERLANNSEIFKLDFNDVSSIAPDKIGYIAVCKAYNILNGDTGNLIRPKDNTTTVETAIAVFRALENLK